MVLSKTSLLKGFQCQKQLYLYKYHYDLMDEVSNAQQKIFDIGHYVGKLARDLFPNGVDCSTETAKDYQHCIDKTSSQIETGSKIIYEAGFSFNDIVVIVDIFVIDDDGCRIYEVKSSTKVKEVNIQDAAIQHYVISNLGYNIKDISIVHINNTYVRGTELEVRKLFKIESIKPNIIKILPTILSNIDTLKKILEFKVIPDKRIGIHCSDPYYCSFWNYCWKDIPEYSIFNISRLSTKKKFELYDNGIINIEDIPNDYPLSETQKIQVEAHINSSTRINKKAIKQFLNNIHIPIYFLDFETFAPAIPLFENTRPYQTIPFQYSLHYLDANNTLSHSSYLAEANGDPRLLFLENLIKETENPGDILVYNEAFEKTRLIELAEAFPIYKRKINNRIKRIKDLMLPFQNKDYYCYEMKGSYSIKYVLPALIPDLTYDDLEIANGSDASNSFENLYKEKDPLIVKEIRKYLLDYCNLDTLAMVKIFEVLKSI